MGDSTTTILRSYMSGGVTDAALTEAVHDPRLPTPALVTEAVTAIEAERASGEEASSLALLVLQQRADDEVLQTALSLLQESNPAARQLGCKLLRELPSLDLAPYPHSLQAVKALEQMIAVEDDEEVLTRALDAVGWQCHPAGLDVLLRMQNDERASVRHVVANNLLQVCPEGHVLPDAVTEALLRLARDPDDDIRWSVLYDVAEFPYMFRRHRSQFRAAAAEAQSDRNSSVREQASRACEALDNLNCGSDT